MSYGNRSKEYDWFKGKKDQKGSDPKQSFKTIWRFTKIFLMFSLFFFSMWGCVQVFVIKTDSSVGSGVEFYNSEAEIAPHVTEFKITTTKSSTTPATDVYHVEADGVNVWMNEKQNKAELRTVQAVLTKDENGAQTHKMSDAIKGRNEYARLVNEKGEILDQNNVVAISSAQTIYQGAQGSLLNAITIFDGDIPYKLPATITGDAIVQERYKFALALVNKIDVNTKHFLSTKHDAKTNKDAYEASLKTFNVLGRYLGLNFQKDVLRSQAIAPTGTIKTNSMYFNTTSRGWFTYDGSKWIATTTPPNVIAASPLGLTGTHYLPIITWKHAWTRGFGPFYGLFVWPIAKMGVGITNGMGMHHGWESLFAIIIVVFILRILAFGLTFKSVLQQTKQQEMQAKKAVIDAKYASYKGNKQMEARQKQEVAELYKKEGISPLGALGTMFITMPIFLSIWRVIGGVPHLKATIWLGINFSATSYKELLGGHWQYLPLMIVAGASAALSQLYPRLLTKRRDKNRINVHQKAAMKKNNKTQNIILGVYVVMAIIFSAGIQIYWVVGAVWQVIQTTITHHILINAKKKQKNRVKV